MQIPWDRTWYQIGTWCMVATIMIHLIVLSNTDIDNRLMVAKGWVRERWIRSLGLADANSYM